MNSKRQKLVHLSLKERLGTEYVCILKPRWLDLKRQNSQNLPYEVMLFLRSQTSCRLVKMCIEHYFLLYPYGVIPLRNSRP